ncbi:hypothetical protein PSYAR_20228, partial [Pseudomonas syringae pv. aceris str. M302273]
AQSDDAIFGEYTGPFANKFAPTPCGQKPESAVTRALLRGGGWSGAERHEMHANAGRWHERQLFYQNGIL